MRFSSSLSSSFPYDFNDEYCTFLSLDDTSPFSHFSPESNSSDEPKIHESDNLWNFEQRNCMILSDGNEWMQPVGYDLAFQHPEDLTASNTPSYSDLSQLYGEGIYSQQPFQSGFPQQYSQQPVGSHRRLQSSSSIASTTDSPYNTHASIPPQQYPNTYTQPAGFPTPQAAGWHWDYSSPVSGAQHLPTPSGTPTPEQFSQVVAVAAQGQNQRRTKPSTPSAQAARVRAHNIFRSSLNQQWRPDTYTQSHAQTPIQNVYADMPRTPQTMTSDDAEMHQQQYNAVATTVPKLGRTVSDARADELYNPYSSFGDPSTMAPRPQSQNFLQPQPPILQERLLAANKARSSSPSSPSGHASPFRRSPYGNSSDFNTQGVSQAPTTMPDYGPIDVNTIRSSRRSQKQVKQENDEPKTVSPKDAFPEQPMPKREESYPTLFPESTNSTPLQYAPYNAPTRELTSLTSMAPTAWSYQSTSTPVSTHFDVKQESASQGPQYGPVYANTPSNSNPNYLPPNLASMETTKSDDSEHIDSTDDSGAERPSDTSASSARYTCPFRFQDGSYCGERFEDPASLNRHKKEHNKPAGSSKDDSSLPKMSQAGPHTCKFPNPKTGEPCNSSFSRPYDLTRHEETIHGNRKKSHCPHCQEDKSFSRGDALTRHLRVVHGITGGATGKQRGRQSKS